MKRKQVIYWVFRALRIEDNPSLVYAAQLAERYDAQLIIKFFVWPVFSSNNIRNMHFLLHGLLEMATKARRLNISSEIIQEPPHVYFRENIDHQGIVAVVSDQHVLNEVLAEQALVRDVCRCKGIRFDVINTALVVPVEEASDKLEYAARTIRRKIHDKVKDHLRMLPDLQPLTQECESTITKHDINNVLLADYWQRLPLSNLTPGEDAANKQLNAFLKDGLKRYDQRNDITANAQSYLSAYLHFGMISPKKVIAKAQQSDHENAALFIEEALIRRELAENYCFYNKHYTSLKQGAWPWAVNTLLEHVFDPREYVYTLEQFEQAKTHDDVWNYCQQQVLKTGYLHSYLRMYWAKMVLYWTEHPQDAIDILVYLNDTYMLDGRDPNGYTGIMWSVAGVHDRPWFTKPITGLVRSMSKAGTLKKTKLEI